MTFCQMDGKSLTDSAYLRGIKIVIVLGFLQG